MSVNNLQTNHLGHNTTSSISRMRDSFEIDSQVHDSDIRSRNSHNSEHEGSSNDKVTCLKSDRVLGFDSFGQSLNFNFHRGSSLFRSSSGAFLSIVLQIVVLVFTVQQTIMLFKYKGTSFTSASVLGYHDSDYVFDESQGLNFAIGLVDV